MSKTEFNSYLIKTILHVLNNFLDKNIGRTAKNMAEV